jgi:hypothetical protein
LDSNNLLILPCLEEAMCTIPIPELPNFTKNFVLECDAFGKGIGVVLMKDGRPLVFARKQLSKRHLGQYIYEK